MIINTSISGIRQSVNYDARRSIEGPKLTGEVDIVHITNNKLIGVILELPSKDNLALHQFLLNPSSGIDELKRQIEIEYSIDLTDYDLQIRSHLQREKRYLTDSDVGKITRGSTLSIGRAVPLLVSSYLNELAVFSEQTSREVIRLTLIEIQQYTKESVFNVNFDQVGISWNGSIN